MQDTHFAPCNSSCSKYGGAEQLLRYRLRARECEENTARLNLRQCARIQSLVTLHSIAQDFVVLGKCWRVENYHIVLVANILQILHSIARQRGVRCILAKVELYIFIYQSYCTLRSVNRADLLRSTCQSIDREASRVAESVQYGATFGVLLHEVAVETLIDEEASLLSLLPIYEELMTILHHYIILLG